MYLSYVYGKITVQHTELSKSSDLDTSDPKVSTEQKSFSMILCLNLGIY